MHVLFPVAAVGEASVTAIKFTLKRLLTCMCSFVDFQIFRSGEYFPTSGERAWERFLARVHTDVVDEFVLGLKRFPFSRAVLPVADVVALLGPADVLHGHMSDHLVHRAESPVASLFGSVHLILVYPFAG